MPTRSALTKEEISERIQVLWDELAEFEVAHHDQALEHLLKGLCELVGAQNANWFGAVRLPDIAPGDPIHGWRPRFLRFLYPAKPLDTAVKRQIDRLEQPEPSIDITTIRNVSFAGRLRANRLADLVLPEWFDSDYYRDFYLGVDHSDAIWAGCPVNVDAEVYFGIFRSATHPPFTADECDTVREALRGLKWFHRQFLLSHGLLVASSPLTPVEREVLKGLLAGLTEKEIAASQNRGLHTTHEYVKMLYRKFSVKNRASLMALWLGKLA